MPRLLVEKGPDRGKSVSVAVGGQVVAGRDKDASLQLSDTMASRRHFMIASKGSIFGLKDLNSANGTLVNGRQAEGAHRLQYGDSIQVGETLISWLADETTDKHGGLIGQQIGGYRIEERLGRGAMGTVYKATQLSLGRTVALKVLSQDLVKDEKFCEMFVKEARAAGSLNHPNIIQVYDVGDEAGQYFFSMEYAAKGSVLEELSAVKAIAMPRAVKIIKDACSALDYAERKGLVHRDIKPDNLMVTEDDSVKLGDLGLAMSTQELQAEQDGVFGTPHYIAPEQAMGKPIDHRADIYALGATFYRMLTGRTLFTGSTVKEILKKQVREPHTPVTEHMPDCPQAIARIIDRMLVKNPAERYQHASEIITDLSDWENLAARKAGASSAAFGMAPDGLTPEQSQELASFNANKKLLIAGIVAFVAILAAAFSIYWFVIRTPAPQPNNTTANTVQPVNNAGNKPANNGGDKGLPPAVAHANQAIRDEMNIANFQVENDPKEDDYAKAISRIEDAIAKNPKASPAVLDKARKRVEQLKQQLDALKDGALKVSEKWENVRRDAEAKIAEWLYKAADEAISGFVQTYETSKNPEVLKVVKTARDYLTTTYPASVAGHLQSFETKQDQALRLAAGEVPAERVSAYEDVLKNYQDAQKKCDSPNYKLRLEKGAQRVKVLLTGARLAARREEKRAVRDAFDKASDSLHDMLEKCRRDIVQAGFKSAQKRLKDWQAGNAEFIEYKDRPEFKRVVRDLERRADQIELEQAALVKLADALPNIVNIKRTIKVKPWPENVAKFLGGPEYLLRLNVDSSLSDAQWSISVNDGLSLTLHNRGAADIDTREKRAALCDAITFLLENTDGALDELMKPASSGGPPALVGVFAWMSELEAYSAAYPLIEYAYKHTGSGDPQHALVREYYAWGLLGKANALAADGDTSAARALITRLEKEFADTRANRGRK